MSSETDSIIQLGHDVMSHKYHAVATGTVLCYDYLLTLADEVEYAWSGKKSWTFWLYIFNRYFPITYLLWELGGRGLSFELPHSSESHLNDAACEKTAWFSLVVFVVCTILAQMVLTIRIYAVTIKSIPITLVFLALTASQFALGVCMVTLGAREGGQPLPQIPLDAYHLCVFNRHRNIEVAYTSLSLVYDSLAFSLVMYLARKLRAPGGAPMILDIIAKDATWYFLVVFSSHLVLVLTLNFARPTIQLLPGPGIVVYLPVMISRIMLSLRKAAGSRESAWSLSMGPISTGTNFQSIRFFSTQRGTGWREDGIPLETFPES
ncbi:hypothetical protein BJ322DRAFT_1178256 [Thelephora terrestris]|uniref:DUF6533 domain-containing protein n=1 Tax=Thelephora terrestris TaxID=56493 RepID=A0A9P6HKY2_9AGAM|nr:hypothetical protein BJ322DRAFT_1178256 [Thelephora terrestris]